MELLADLVERCQHRLVRYLLYLTGRREYAEDLAQETWIRVLQPGSQYNERQHGPCLFTIPLTIVWRSKKKSQTSNENSIPLRYRNFSIGIRESKPFL